MQIHSRTHLLVLFLAFIPFLGYAQHDHNSSTDTLEIKLLGSWQLDSIQSIGLETPLDSLKKYGLVQEDVIHSIWPNTEMPLLSELVQGQISFEFKKNGIFKLLNTEGLIYKGSYTLNKPFTTIKADKHQEMFITWQSWNDDSLKGKMSLDVLIDESGMRYMTFTFIARFNRKTPLQ